MKIDALLEELKGVESAYLARTTDSTAAPTAPQHGTLANCVYPQYPPDLIPPISPYHVPAKTAMDRLSEGAARLMGWTDAWGRLMEMFPHIELQVPENNSYGVVTFEVVFPAYQQIIPHYDDTPGFLVWNLRGVAPGFWTSAVIPRINDIEGATWEQRGPEDYAVKLPGTLDLGMKFMSWLVGKEARRCYLLLAENGV